MIPQELVKKLIDAGLPPNEHTLSDLIAACGPEFGKLEAPWSGCPRWVSVLRRGATQKFYTKGDTPEEAVAQLWLAINENIIK